jgi:hypothetical protein
VTPSAVSMNGLFIVLPPSLVCSCGARPACEADLWWEAASSLGYGGQAVLESE